MKTILFFQTGSPETARLKFEGVASFARTAGWDARIITNASTRQPLGKILSFWKPAGCIVEASGGAQGLSPSAFGKTPVVYQCHDPRIVAEVAPCVTSDSAAIGSLAARELAALSPANSLAFVGWFGKVYWSDTRRASFLAEANRIGRMTSEFTPTKSETEDATLLQKRLREWLKTLPKPCGVFAVNDEIGSHVLAAARANRMKIPEEVSVLGVDNDELLCESATPHLSSVRLDYRRTGHMAAELLSRILEGEKVLGHFTVPPDGLMRRASSRVFHREDKSAKKAVETIHRRACDGLKPSDILALFDCSRRLAEIRFKAATGKTITEEIQSVRMDAVYELLARPEVPISVIAARCGWPNDSFLRRIFRRKTGHSLSEERARLTKDTIAQAGRH